MKIALAADHAGYLLKDELAAWLREQGHEVTDLGTNNGDSVDYPDFGARLARAVASGEAERGVAVCGSGVGISIAINRDPKCRCARVDDPLSAALARDHARLPRRTTAPKQRARPSRRPADRGRDRRRDAPGPATTDTATGSGR